MERDDLDRLLSDDTTLVPSSGFAAGVMDAVRREASEPQAIPFPWKRALPGIVATALALVSTLVSGFLAFNAPSAQALSEGPTESFLKVIVAAATSAEIAWVVFATLLTWGLVASSMRLARRRS
jgi:hypothetical protein